MIICLKFSVWKIEAYLDKHGFYFSNKQTEHKQHNIIQIYAILGAIHLIFTQEGGGIKKKRMFFVQGRRGWYMQVRTQNRNSKFTSCMYSVIVSCVKF